MLRSVFMRDASEIYSVFQYCMKAPKTICFTLSSHKDAHKSSKIWYNLSLTKMSQKTVPI